MRHNIVLKTIKSATHIHMINSMLYNSLMSLVQEAGWAGSKRLRTARLDAATPG